MSADDNTIRPFLIDVPEEEVAELRRRVAATRWPERETVTDAFERGDPPPSDLSAEERRAFTWDDILDNITLYWLTNTGVSSARLYWESKADFFDGKNISIPFAISVFPDEMRAAFKTLR